MNNLTWSEVYKHRFEWAKSAHSKFMLNFDNDLYSTHEIKDQIFVAVYGASQVGKTSLILELIGVLPEHHSMVQNVLRADRDYGRSATATVVRYRASSDNYWHIHDVSESSNDRKNLNKNQAKKVLAKIRSDMEVMGDQYNVEEIDISIPEEYLSKKSDRYKDITKCLCGLCISMEDLETIFNKEIVTPEEPEEPEELEVYYFQFDSLSLAIGDSALVTTDWLAANATKIVESAFLDGIVVPLPTIGRIGFTIKADTGTYSIYDELGQNVTDIVFNTTTDVAEGRQIFISKEYYAYSTLYFQLIKN